MLARKIRGLANWQFWKSHRVISVCRSVDSSWAIGCGLKGLISFCHQELTKRLDHHLSVFSNNSCISKGCVELSGSFLWCLSLWRAKSNIMVISNVERGCFYHTCQCLCSLFILYHFCHLFQCCKYRIRDWSAMNLVQPSSPWDRFPYRNDSSFLPFNGISLLFRVSLFILFFFSVHVFFPFLCKICSMKFLVGFLWN